MDAKLTFSRRQVFGKKAQQLRDDGLVIANIYGKGRESVAVSGDAKEVEKVVTMAGKNHPIDITIDDEQLLALVSEVERDYKTQKIHHVTFQVVIKGQKVTTEVPVHLIGEAPAAKAGLIVVKSIDTIEIEAIPSKIPEELTASAEGLVVDGDSIHVSDLAVPEDVELKAEPDQLIAKVETPRAEIESEETEEGEDVDAADVPSDHGGEETSEGEETQA